MKSGCAHDPQVHPKIHLLYLLLSLLSIFSGRCKLGGGRQQQERSGLRLSGNSRSGRLSRRSAAAGKATTILLLASLQRAPRSRDADAAEEAFQRRPPLLLGPSPTAGASTPGGAMAVSGGVTCSVTGAPNSMRSGRMPRTRNGREEVLLNAGRPLEHGGRMGNQWD